MGPWIGVMGPQDLTSGFQFLRGFKICSFGVFSFVPSGFLVLFRLGSQSCFVQFCSIGVLSSIPFGFSILFRLGSQFFSVRVLSLIRLGFSFSGI